MQRLLVSMMLVSSLLLGGCSLVYKIDIQQGNEVSAEKVAKLKLGMNKKQVQFVMGTPMIQHNIAPQRWDYLYSLKRDGEPLERREVQLLFDGDTLAKIIKKGVE